ncbi:hypothetical protein JCM8097_000279 [Rhodosporidiobolus ruineniae]
MDTYAAQSLDSVNWFSYANQHVFPKLCNGAGYTDVDAYCTSGTSDVCCGLCPNTSVSGLFQFIWAIFVYALGSFSYVLAPGAIWGLTILQVMNVWAFIMAGAIRVWDGATVGSMSYWHTMFLYPQALGVIVIEAGAVFSPMWARLGKSYLDMTKESVKLSRAAHERSARPTEHEPLQRDVRQHELTLVKGSYKGWAGVSLGFWFGSLAIWTGAGVWLAYGGVEYSQANCDGDVVDQAFSPAVAALVLGVIAWLFFFLDLFVVYKKQGLGDYIVERLNRGKDLTFREHREKERKITIYTCVALYLLWAVINCYLFADGLHTFLLTGADYVTYAQIEQIWAVTSALLSTAIAIRSYLEGRDDLREERTVLGLTGYSSGEDSASETERERERARARGEEYGRPDAPTPAHGRHPDNLLRRFDSPESDNERHSTSAARHEGELRHLHAHGGTFYDSGSSDSDSETGSLSPSHHSARPPFLHTHRPSRSSDLPPLSAPSSSSFPHHRSAPSASSTNRQHLQQRGEHSRRHPEHHTSQLETAALARRRLRMQQHRTGEVPPHPDEIGVALSLGRRSREGEGRRRSGSARRGGGSGGSEGEEEGLLSER